MAHDRSPDGGPTYDGWTSPNARAAFWMVSVVGTGVLVIAWFWYGFAFFEEMTEQCKALAADSSAAGTGLLFGVLPLAIAYVLFSLPLAIIGMRYRARSRTGVMFAVAIVVAASLVAIGVNEVVWGGKLFTMSAGSATCTSP